MSKEVLLVFQDCPYCAPREEWGKAQMEIARTHGIKVREVHFTVIGVKGLIQKAKSSGVDALPFFTDGKRFSYNLKDFVSSKKAEVEAKVVKAARRNAKKVTEEVADGEEIAEES